jgi:hypothetical protein
VPSTASSCSAALRPSSASDNPVRYASHRSAARGGIIVPRDVVLGFGGFLCRGGVLRARGSGSGRLVGGCGGLGLRVCSGVAVCRLKECVHRGPGRLLGLLLGVVHIGAVELDLLLFLLLSG